MTEVDVAITHSEHLPRTVATVRIAAVAALIMLIPFNVHFDAFIQEHSPHLVGSGVQQTRLGPVDMAFVLIIIVTAHLLIKRSTYTSQPMGQLGMAVAVGTTAIWLLIFPSVEGSMMLLRVVGMFATVVAIRHMKVVDLMPGIVWPLAIGASFQALIALSQTLLNDSGMIVPATTLAVGRAWTAGRGTFSGPYSLAAYLILALAVMLSFGVASRAANERFASLSITKPTQVAMWTTVVLSSAAVATTFGRTVLLSVLLVAVTYAVGWLIKHHRIYGLSTIATVVPVAAVGIVVRSGWLVRATQTAAGDLTTRGSLAERAVEMIQANPILGIGPVQYGPNLAKMGLPVPDVHVVHNLPLLVAAEFGVVIGVTFTVWIVMLGVRSVRLSAFAAALFLFAVPFFMLDNLHYVYGNGMASFAIWLALLDYQRRGTALAQQDSS